MNLPEPSGSSPPEKPPGSMMICALSDGAFSMRAMVSSIAAGDRFLTTRTSASAPAFSKARAVSYSQLVPGKTGMNTRGRGALMAGDSPLCWV